MTETVNAVKQLKKAWAAKLINGVLRNALREKKNLQEKIPEDLTAVYNHPLWLIEKIQLAYPDDWQAILENNQQHPPMTLRLNVAKLSRENYLHKLKEENIGASLTTHSIYGIALGKPQSVSEVNGFNEGLVSVQDESAQLAASLLELSSGQNVLDACAAPGGKTTHILELEPKLNELVAVDHDAIRLQLIQSNLDRLNVAVKRNYPLSFSPSLRTHEVGEAIQKNVWIATAASLPRNDGENGRQAVSAKLIGADIKNFAVEWQPAYFDRILLDVPCSATGVIRRHPDIKLLRKSSDIVKLAKEQYEILMAVWPLLKPGGILLYATCSILPEENFLILEAFLKNTSDAKEEPIMANWGKAMLVGRQILPGEFNMDGFYYARLRKYTL